MKDLTDESQFASTKDAFERLYEIVRKLRSPEGCPWDREQNPQTMRSDLVEEVFEAEDAITQNDANHVKEELGDVFLNTVMISYMYEQTSDFDVKSVLNEVSNKIIRRHPHVWKESEGKANALPDGIKSTSDVLTQWDAIKQGIEGRKEKCVLDEVAHGLPPLLRAYKIQKKAAKKGFDWDDDESVWAKVNEEISELKEACNEKDENHVSEELGDLLFSVVNLSRHLGVNPVLALANANTKFRNRYAYVEEKMNENNIPMEKGNLEPMDKFWNEAKKNGL